MKMYFVGLVLSALFLFPNSFFPQTFKTSPYITLPGNNTDVDVVNNIHYGNISSFITWVNHSDSNYTLYLRQTSPDYAKNIAIYSDTTQIANPSIDFLNSSNYNNVRIAWQSFVNNHWQILSRKYENDSLTNIIPITDSLADNISPKLSMVYVTWIQNGNLIYKSVDSANAKPYIIDSADCSNPSVVKLSYDYPQIVYEKGPAGSKQIIEAYYAYYYDRNPAWSFSKISNGGSNKNPRYGTEEASVSYQEFDNGVWKSISPIFRNDTTGNLSYNCENPVSLSYPILSKKTYFTTPFFVVYDSDSLKNNKEIIMKTGFSSSTTLNQNISNAEGDDYLPNISFCNYMDTVRIAIYWTHEQNNKKDIWVASSVYSPNVGVVDDPIIGANSFVLNQNYPNPFNPSTTISWQLEKSSAVTLKIYDILGNEITTLVNEYQNAGKHSITFDTQQALKHNLSSGIYFYQLKAGSNITAKKMLYLK